MIYFFFSWVFRVVGWRLFLEETNGTHSEAWRHGEAWALCKLFCVQNSKESCGMPRYYDMKPNSLRCHYFICLLCTEKSSGWLFFFADCKTTEGLSSDTSWLSETQIPHYTAILVCLQEHMQNLCEGHCPCHVEQMWWKHGFPWALCTRQRNHFGLGFCFLFVQTIVVFVEIYHLEQKNKKVVSGEAGINQNPITEGLLWAGNARKEWPGICLCWGQCSCKLHHILGKTCAVCLFGACVLLSHSLPVSLCLSSTKISAARSLSSACAGMLLLSGGFFKHFLTSVAAEHFALWALHWPECQMTNVSVIRWDFILKSGEGFYV